ncbi:FMN-dependent NADH-azoreductase [Sphingosinicella terrae]|jgi:FMN-dependent NADH-azoreductase|uniref:FMN-dependent NADH-azoreductase n=1 Tax=Sphingosinicella terrae TaxID=2172047 RepID=UPI000E0D8C64|nr:FMN-dependent NADH-azoreductase [Sphingosinicella terrae]
MNNVLIVTSSAQAGESVSTRLADDFASALLARHPGAKIVRRDVGTEPIPHLTPATVAGVRAEPRTEAEQEARALSDRLIAELQAADLIVIASPMYNFGMSSTLKTWFDHVLRARVTFRYTETGPEGLLKDKKAIVIESRGGLYSEGPAGVMDTQEPHIRTLLGFMGIDDVEWVRAERLGFPDAAEASIGQAAARLRSLGGGELPLAA